MHLSNLDYRVVNCIFSLVYLLDQNECNMKVNKKIKATELCLYIKSPVYIFFYLKKNSSIYFNQNEMNVLDGSNIYINRVIR